MDDDGFMGEKGRRRITDRRLSLGSGTLSLPPPPTGVSRMLKPPSLSKPGNSRTPKTPRLSPRQPVVTSRNSNAVASATYLEERTKMRLLEFLVCSAYELHFKVPERRLMSIHGAFDGTFFVDVAPDTPISEGTAKAVAARIDGWLAKAKNGRSDSVVEFDTISREQALSDATKAPRTDVVELIQCRPRMDPIPIVRIEGVWDILLEPLSCSVQSIQYSVGVYDGGLLVRLPQLQAPEDGVSKEKKLPGPEKARVFINLRRGARWQNEIGIRTVPELNRAVRSEDVRELMWVAEARHERQISDIAHDLVKNMAASRVVAVAGPSSSGKTTFAHRLGISIRSLGRNYIRVGMDDYYKNRVDTPKTTDGEYDYESLESLSLDLLVERVKALIAGKTIPARKYDFRKGLGYDEGTTRLGENEFVIIEGIHGINPKFTSKLGSLIRIVYISPLDNLIYDYHHRISTSDNRLLRRLVRDVRARGHPIEETLNRWGAVRTAEEANIFQYQNKANYYFNSSLLHELAVLGPLVAPLLRPGTESSDPLVKAECTRLLNLVNYFEPLAPEPIPGNSLLREFVGDLDFDKWSVPPRTTSSQK